MLTIGQFSHSGKSVSIQKLSDLKTGQKCCIIGTVFKKMELEPSILNEISQQVCQCFTIAKAMDE